MTPEPLLDVAGMPAGRERVYRCADCGLEADGFTPGLRHIGAALGDHRLRLLQRQVEPFSINPE